MLRIVLICSFIFFAFGFTPADNGGENPVIGLENKIVISPNPAITTTKVFSKNNSLRIKKLEVFTILNERIFSINSDVPKSAIELNVMKLRNGKYFVKVYLTDGTENYATLIKVD